MNLFIETVLRMSIYGSIAILLVVLLRAVFKKVPKKTVVLFWIVAAVRLVCPLNFGTSVSLFNLAPQSVTENLRPLYFIDNESDASITPLNAFVPGTADVSASLAPGTDNTVKTDANGVTPSNVPHPSVGSADHTAETFPAADVTTGSFMPAAADETSSSTIAFFVWLTGAAVIILFVVISVIRANRVLTHRFKRSGGYMESDAIRTPFVIGLINPKICVPSEIDISEKDYMLLHEHIHVKNHDAFIKAFALFVLCLHWFNPLVWLAFRLCMSDLEMRCDEEVIDIFGDRIRKDYCLSIVNHAAADDEFRVFTTAFAKKSIGRMEIKMRIKNLINYKKVSRLTTAIVLIIALTASFVLTSCAQDIVSDKTPDTQDTTLSYTHGQINYRLFAGNESFGYGPDGVVTDYRFFYNDEAIPSFDILKPHSVASVENDDINLMIKAESFDYVGDIKLSIINTKTDEMKTDILRGPVLTPNLWPDYLDTCKVVTPLNTSLYIQGNEKLLSDIDMDGFPFGSYEGSHIIPNVDPTAQNIRIGEKPLAAAGYGKAFFPEDFTRPAEEAFDPIYVNEMVYPVEINIKDYPNCLPMAVSQEDYVTYIIYNYSNDSVYDGVVLVNTTNYANKSNYSQAPAPGDPVLTIKTSSNNEDSVVVGVQTNFDQDKFYIPVSATFDSFDEFKALYSSKTAKAVLSGDYDANDPRITSILWNRLEDNGPGILTEYTDKADYYIFHRYFEDSKTQFYILYSVKDRTLGCYEFIPTQLVTQSKIGTYFDTFDDFKSFYSAENMEKVLAGEYDAGDPRVDIVSWSHFAESEENLVTDYINNPNYYILHRKGEDGKTQFSLTYFPATHTIVRLEFV